MAKSWRIDSLHIGLATVGDSSIHLLIEERPPSNPGIVRWALLVDSGAQARLVQTIDWIASQPARYDLTEHHPNHEQKLTFDAVVITHWDMDHWSGVLHAMSSDIRKSTTKDRVSFFRYTNDAARHPRTVLYCPEEDYRSGPDVPLPKFTEKPISAAAEAVGFKYGRRASDVVDNVCIVRMEPIDAGAETIIGTNLIEAEDLDPGHPPATITSPTDLVNRNRPAEPGKPGIYVVGASRRVIGFPPTAFAVPPDELVEALDDVGIVDDASGTATNSSSIACLAIWQPRALDPPRLSQYFAGDMHWKQEKSLVEWSGTTGDRTKVGEFVTTVKLSHHGAKSSTPVDLLANFNPYNLIASVGERNGHPSKISQCHSNLNRLRLSNL